MNRSAGHVLKDKACSMDIRMERSNDEAEMAAADVHLNSCLWAITGPKLGGKLELEASTLDTNANCTLPNGKRPESGTLAAPKVGWHINQLQR